MLVTEPLGIAPHQPTFRVCVWKPGLEDELKRWAGAVEEQDCRFLGQIQDPGRGRHIAGRNAVAIGASALPDDLSWTVPHALTPVEIGAFIGNVVEAALRLQRCGFSGVEISAGHGHLFHQFLSPWSNRRNDEYGGDLAGRARFLVELAQAVRSSCGSTFILGVKLPGDDGVPGGIGPTEAADVARHLVSQVSVDYLCYAQGAHHRTLEMHVPNDSYPRLPYRGLISVLRKSVPGVPVMTLGRITDPAEAEGLLAGDDADLIGLGRALIADPAWPAKARSGHARDIRYCVNCSVNCNTCWKTIAHTAIACDNNPALATPAEIEQRPRPATIKRNVVIVGAGVAGLEAAWRAAARGHRVTVFGASREVGGKTRLHASLPNSESLSSVYDYQWVAAQKAGVRFELGAIAGLDAVLACKPDAVVLATGSTMIWPECLPRELERDGIVPDLRTAMSELLPHKQRQAGTAVIFDMDHMDGTYAAAELLSARFENVVVLTPRESIASETALVTRLGIQRRFHTQGIRVECLVEPRWSDDFESAGRLELAHVYGGPMPAIDGVSFFPTPRHADPTTRSLRR